MEAQGENKVGGEGERDDRRAGWCQEKVRWRELVEWGADGEGVGERWGFRQG